MNTRKKNTIGKEPVPFYKIRTIDTHIHIHKDIHNGENTNASQYNIPQIQNYKLIVSFLRHIAKLLQGK